MWFDNKLSTAYELGIKPALQACGYKLPFRVDDKEIDSSGYVPKIDDRIMAAIRRARFLVADITGARVAVYFEAGFAEGLGIPIIWTCRKASAKKDMCFDTRQHEHVLWTEPEDLRAALVAKIGARGWDRTVG
jgi:nucleoside 2-deoxyribosyltransferase